MWIYHCLAIKLIYLCLFPPALDWQPWRRVEGFPTLCAWKLALLCKHNPPCHAVQWMQTTFHSEHVHVFKGGGGTSYHQVQCGVNYGIICMRCVVVWYFNCRLGLWKSLSGYLWTQLSWTLSSLILWSGRLHILIYYQWIQLCDFYIPYWKSQQEQDFNNFI